MANGLARTGENITNSAQYSAVHVESTDTIEVWTFAGKTSTAFEGGRCIPTPSLRQQLPGSYLYPAAAGSASATTRLSTAYLAAAAGFYSNCNRRQYRYRNWALYRWH